MVTNSAVFTGSYLTANFDQNTTSGSSSPRFGASFYTESGSNSSSTSATVASVLTGILPKMQSSSNLVAGLIANVDLDSPTFQTSTGWVTSLWAYVHANSNFTSISRLHTIRSSLTLPSSVFGSVSLGSAIMVESSSGSNIIWGTHAGIYVRAQSIPATSVNAGIFVDAGNGNGSSTINGGFVLNGASTAGTQNYGFWVRSNTASSGAAFVAGTSGDVQLFRFATNVWTFNPNTRLRLDGGNTNNVAVFAANGNLRLGSDVGTALATTATTGWPMMPSVAGTPTGVPQNESVNSASFTWDRTNKRLCIRDQPTNAWVCFSGTGVSSIAGTAGQITASASTGAVTLSLPTFPYRSVTSFASSILFFVGACGSTGASLTVTGAPESFKLTLVAGSGACSASSAAFQFSWTWSGASDVVCTMTPQTATAVGVVMGVDANASAFVGRVGTVALTASTTYVWNVMCMGTV